MLKHKRHEGNPVYVPPKRHGVTIWAYGLIVLIVGFGVGLEVGNGRLQVPMLHKNQSENAQLPRQLNYQTVTQVYDSLKDNYDGKLTQSQLLDGLKHGLAESTKDPYTAYFTPAEAKSFDSELNNSFSGIGAELGKDSDGNLEVIAPIAGTPADKAGLKAQDLIAEVNGEPTSTMSVDEAVNKIRGKAGTKVTLTIIRDKTQSLKLTITRNNLQIPSVNSKVLDGNIGYIQITTFANDTSGLFEKAAGQMADQHVKGVVLDLRNDPGGLLDAAIDVSSQWLPSGTTILQEKRGSTITQTYTAESDSTPLKGIPTVVLINEGSASASEITAGALHDNNAARIIGVKSYGKGVVQQLIDFNDGSELKVTIASWYRPDGKNINHLGITPDQTVADPKSADPSADTQLQAAETYLNK